MKTQLVIEAEAALGEGAIWDYRTEHLYWVDILSDEVHRYSPASQKDEVFPVGRNVGTVVPRAAGGLVVALQDGVYLLDPDTGKLDVLADVESDLPANRFNDGKCDPQGRFWVGSTSLTCDVPGAGSLYCIDIDLSVRRVLSELTIANGIVWTADGKTMFFIDSPKQEIWGFDFDTADGKLGRKRTAVSIPAKDGLPDGMTIDSEDMLWVAHFGGGRVCRYDPKSGAKLQEIIVPASQVTSCAFGGAALDRLYITTARTGLDAKALAKEPQAGSLFVAKPGATGVKASFFRG